MNYESLWDNELHKAFCNSGKDIVLKQNLELKNRALKKMLKIKRLVGIFWWGGESNYQSIKALRFYARIWFQNLSQ